MSDASASKEKKMIVLRSSDGETFEVEEAVALQSETIKQVMEVDCANSPIPLPNVTSKILKEVIVYCKRHAAAAAAKATGNDTLSFDARKIDDLLVKELMADQETLFGIIMAANYLSIKSLFDFTCNIVADMMRWKTAEEIRRIFHIKNDYTKEEEQMVRWDNPWAFFD